MVKNQEKKDSSKKMAIVKEDRDSFDIMPLSEAEKQAEESLKDYEDRLFSCIIFWG